MLRIGAYQILYLEKIPPSAAVNGPWSWQTK
ncbi:MAG: transcription antitermination factor NusB [Anaeromassilibacillus sp.]